jgi:hypothetical protein
MNPLNVVVSGGMLQVDVTYNQTELYKMCWLASLNLCVWSFLRNSEEIFLKYGAGILLKLSSPSSFG